MTVGCFAMGLSLEEALAAVTVNAACSLGLQAEAGSLEVGKRADLVVLRRARLLDLVRVGVPAVRTVVKDGRVVVRDGRRVLPDAPVLVVEDLVKTYPALAQEPGGRGRARHLVPGGGGRDVRPAGPERGRQEHDPRLHHDPRASHVGPRRRSTASTWCGEPVGGQAAGSRSCPRRATWTAT